MRRVKMSKRFLEGMGRVIALFGSQEEPKFSLPSHSDEEAIYQDWQQAGSDIWKAAKLYQSGE